MKVQVSFNAGFGTVTIGELKYLPSSLEFYSNLREGVLEWARKLGPGKHSLTVSAYVKAEESAQLEVLMEVAELWNRDPEIQALESVFVEILLGNNKDAWFGSSTAVDHSKKFEARPRMEAFSYKALLERAERESAELAEAERQRRRANPVQSAVKLPRGIASRIASYLRLEYGESRWSRTGLKARDLVFEGEYVIDGVPTQFWRYPIQDGKGRAWATVERFDDNYCLGMSESGPPQDGES